MPVTDRDLFGWVWLGVGADLALWSIVGLVAVMTFMLGILLTVSAMGLFTMYSLGALGLGMSGAMGLVMPGAVELITVVTLVASHPVWAGSGCGVPAAAGACWVGNGASSGAVHAGSLDKQS